jgi:hypothetical protein
MAALFLLQTFVGAASQHCRAEITGFFGSSSPFHRHQTVARKGVALPRYLERPCKAGPFVYQREMVGRTSCRNFLSKRDPANPATSVLPLSTPRCLGG